MVTGLFNSLLDRPPQSAIDMERIHCALRPKGRDRDPPKDINCRIVDFKLKEEILRQARGQPQLTHEGVNIQIYQDLSSIALQPHRDLKPLLDSLHDKGIQYKWKFPFCLSASSQGHTALLNVPEDLLHFCEILGIPLVDVPNWYADFRRPTVRKSVTPEEPMDAQPTRYRRRRSPSGQRQHTASRNHRQDHSSSYLPRSRRNPSGPLSPLHVSPAICSLLATFGSLDLRLP